jgi:hypothetical protein
MENIITKAIQTALTSEIAFSKYITANDVGATGGHQSGFHLHKNSWPLFFNNQGEKGGNKDKWVTIRWQDQFETASRFIYYGVKTRNDYRLTRLGRGFPFFEDENIGDLLVICKKTENYFEAFVLQTDEDVDAFFAALNISSTDTNGIIPKEFQLKSVDKMLQCFMTFIKGLKKDFPPTIDLAYNSRICYNSAYGITEEIIKTYPDREIINWLDAEFQLFKLIEIDRYQTIIKTPFQSVEELIATANTILNRRKSRAGKSLEHHLSEIFKSFQLSFDTQSLTEDNKRPDFIFPNLDAYNSRTYSTKNLVMLASKTTCKDRWRQILNEADRIKTKHLFTLQQGISKNQLEEMYKYNVCLVIPKQYIKSFPEEFRQRILTLEGFVNYIQKIQK